MTRGEITNSRAYQLSKAALEYYNEHHSEKDIDLTDAFEAGVDWADKKMIDKACEWLEEKNKMCMYELEMILGGNFIKDFKKAMES